MKTTYRHSFKTGIVATMTVDTNPPCFSVEWSGRPGPEIIPEYLLWRGLSLDDFQTRTGKKILVLDVA